MEAFFDGGTAHSGECSCNRSRGESGTLLWQFSDRGYVQDGLRRGDPALARETVSENFLQSKSQKARCYLRATVQLATAHVYAICYETSRAMLTHVLSIPSPTGSAICRHGTMCLIPTRSKRCGPMSSGESLTGAIRMRYADVFGSPAFRRAGYRRASHRWSLRCDRRPIRQRFTSTTGQPHHTCRRSRAQNGIAICPRIADTAEQTRRELSSELSSDT